MGQSGASLGKEKGGKCSCRTQACNGIVGLCKELLKRIKRQVSREQLMCQAVVLDGHVQFLTQWSRVGKAAITLWFPPPALAQDLAHSVNLHTHHDGGQVLRLEA